MRLISTGLSELESVDEEAVLYLRSPNDTNSFQLSLVALTAEYPAIQTSIRAVSVCRFIVKLACCPANGNHVLATSHLRKCWYERAASPGSSPECEIKQQAASPRLAPYVPQQGVNATILTLSGWAAQSPAQTTAQLTAGETLNALSNLSLASRSSILVRLHDDLLPVSSRNIICAAGQAITGIPSNPNPSCVSDTASAP